jgi:hypothetical protein
MAKVRKQVAEPEPPLVPQIGDRVIPERSDSEFIITGVRSEGRFVDLELPGTNLTRFMVDVETLKFVDRAPRPSQKSLNLKVGPNADLLIERIETIQREDLQHLEEDIELLTKYLKNEGAPTAAIKAVESLRREHNKSWETVVNRIKELME